MSALLHDAAKRLPSDQQLIYFRVVIMAHSLACQFAAMHPYALRLQPRRSASDRLVLVTCDGGSLYMCGWCYQQEPEVIVIKFKETERLILCAYARKPLMPLIRPTG
jgi:hypothetical protein